MNQLSRKTLSLLLVLIAVVALTVFVLWKGFTEPTPRQTEVEGVEKARLDFSLLESERVSYLESFQPLPEFEGEMGRSNPFSSYKTTATTATTTLE